MDNLKEPRSEVFDKAVSGELNQGLEDQESDRQWDLKESGNQFGEIANSITDLLFAMDDKLRYTFWNRASEEVTGIKTQEALGKSLFAIFPDNENTREAARVYQEVLKMQKPRTFVNEHEHFGHRRTYEIRAYPSGTGVAVWARDITERRLAEEALKKTEKELRSIYNAISGHLTVVDKNYRIMSYNKAVERRFGNDLEGRKCYEAYQARKEICPGCAVKKTLDTVKPAFTFQPATEISDPVEIHTYPIFDDAGEIAAVVEHGIEVSEKIKIEEALRESEEKFRLMADNAPDIVYTVDREGTIEYINRIPECMEMVVGANILDYVSTQYRQTVKQALHRVFDTGDRETLEISTTGPYDITSWYSTRLGPIKSGNDVIAAVMITRDITAYKLTEEALRESEDRCHTLFDAVADAIYVHSITEDEQIGSLVEVNNAACRMLGYTRRELLDKDIRDIEAPDSDIHFCDIVAELNEGEPTVFEQIHIAKDERRIPVKVRSSLLRYRENLSVFSTVQDLTEHKRVEEEREKLQTQLGQVRKMEAVGQLSGGVAHDFNNLLTPIIGYGEMLLNDLSLNDPKRESVEEINRAALRAKEVTKQLLAFGRQQPLDVKTIDLNRVITNFTKMLRRTIREDIDIELLLDTAPLNVRADLGQLEQVIMNLAANSQDAMPDGGKLIIKTSKALLDEISGVRQKAIKPGRYVVLEVIDTGFGMDQKTIDKVFEPFFTTKEVGKGTGLGLATVYGIVKQHGGNIWAHSQPGKGARFEIYLPSADDSVKKEKEPQVNSFALTGTETVLLAEDEKAVRTMVRRVLQRQGYTVLPAGNGDECLHTAEEHDGPIHLLLTDMVMPGMNGKELYNRLSIRFPDVQVLFMSGYTDNMIAQHGVIEQGIHFIQKPFTTQALANKVRETLDAQTN